MREVAACDVLVVASVPCSVLGLSHAGAKASAGCEFAKQLKIGDFAFEVVSRSADDVIANGLLSPVANDMVFQMP